MTHDEQSLLSRALAFALSAHGSQKRKGTQVPYVSHLLQVSGLVFEHGGSATQATAALLHDVVEDCDEISLDRVQQEFGSEVSHIVADCTDTGPDESAGTKRPWKARKTAFLQHLATVSATSSLVIACDKRHNLACMVRDIDVHGLVYLDRFSGSPAQQVWYHSEVARSLRDRVPGSLVKELQDLVECLRIRVDPQ